MFLAAVLKSSTGIPFPSVMAHGTRFSVRHTSNFEFRPRSGRLQAIGCTRWLLVGCFTTKVSTCTRRSTLHSSFFGNCRLLLCCCIAQLLSWLVICVSRVTCDFVSRLGGWDAIFFKGRLIEPVLGGPFFWLRCSSRRHGYLFPLSWRMVPGSCSAHVVL